MCNALQLHAGKALFFNTLLCRKGHKKGGWVGWLFAFTIRWATVAHTRCWGAPSAYRQRRSPSCREAAPVLMFEESKNINCPPDGPCGTKMAYKARLAGSLAFFVTPILARKTINSHSGKKDK